MSLETDMFILMSKTLPLPIQIQKLEQMIALYKKHPTQEHKLQLSMICLMISNHVADEDLTMEEALQRDRQLADWVKIMPKGN